MKPETRTAISIVPLGLQGVAMISGVATVLFFVPEVVAFLKEHEGKLVIPRPTRLLVDHPGAASLVVVGLFSVSVFTFFFTRLKMKDEADRLAVQGAVYGAVWYAGTSYIGGVLMAMALPYFALNSK